MNEPFPIIHRYRLECTVNAGDTKNSRVFQVLNEVSIHRGNHSHLSRIDVSVGSHYLTEAVADGIIVSTPTGSTAYSLSAGGPIVHHGVKAMVLTPICPRSLSFRPIVLPFTETVTFKVSNQAREEAYVAADGQDLMDFCRDSELVVKMSPFPIPFVSATEVDWHHGITSSLRWNQSFVNSKVKL